MCVPLYTFCENNNIGKLDSSVEEEGGDIEIVKAVFQSRGTIEGDPGQVKTLLQQQQQETLCRISILSVAGGGACQCCCFYGREKRQQLEANGKQIPNSLFGELVLALFFSHHHHHWPSRNTIEKRRRRRRRSEEGEEEEGWMMMAEKKEAWSLVVLECPWETAVALEAAMGVSEPLQGLSLSLSHWSGRTARYFGRRETAGREKET